MTGVIAAVLGGGIAAGGGGVFNAGPPAWNDIYGEDSGSTQTLAMTGITAPIQLTASRTGLGVLTYVLNGNYMPYTGAFTVNPNDTLAWAVSITGTIDRSGVITVSNAATSSVVGSFNYSVYSSRGVRA